MPAPSRIERRRAERASRILQIAARRFAAVGVDGVRLDEIADEADIARATLYSHFATKEALVSAIVRPALEQALHDASGIKLGDAREAVRKLLRLYLKLWKAHPDGMRIGHRIQGTPLGDCADLHRAFMKHVLRVFGAACTAGLLRTGDPTLSAMLLARLAIPMLETYGGLARCDDLFLDSMEGVLLQQVARPKLSTTAPAASRSPRK
ncbi:MAG: TetR/AcrR family transcriptional regulator [Deltaproteobacteria bacterium]|nr:TetR/AcrR family transcriptional regulator [Deltaproteobacteria bacterium]